MKMSKINLHKVFTLPEDEPAPLRIVACHLCMSADELKKRIERYKLRTFNVYGEEWVTVEDMRDFNRKEKNATYNVKVIWNRELKK